MVCEGQPFGNDDYPDCLWIDSGPRVVFGPAAGAVQWPVSVVVRGRRVGLVWAAGSGTQRGPHAGLAEQADSANWRSNYSTTHTETAPGATRFGVT